MNVIEKIARETAEAMVGRDETFDWYYETILAALNTVVAEDVEIIDTLHKILGQKRKQIQELKAVNKELAEKAWKYDELCK